MKAVVVETEEMIREVEKLHKSLVESLKSLSNKEIKSSSCTSLEIANDQPRTPAQLFNLEGLPIVSLEESLPGLDEIIPDIQRDVYIAKRNCENPAADGLTLDESAAIMIFTMETSPPETCLRSILNRDLRSESRFALKKWRPYLKLLLNALNKLPPYKGTVWRGVLLDLSDQYQTGARGIWWGVLSTTSNMSVLESEHILGKHGSRTLFSIDCKRGKSIRNHSCFQEEEEVLLLPGFQFEVKNKIHAGNGLRIVNLREVD